MMSVGVEMTSYLQNVRRTPLEVGWDAQFDDMGVPQSSHILEFTPYSSLGLFSLDDGLGNVLHSDLVACHRMYCH
jgi:hypothetical protein